MDYGNKRLLRKHTKRAVVWEQHRAPMDALFVETNLSLACFTKSHTNSAIINGAAAGDMVEEYQHAYMTKEKGGLKSSAAVMLTAIRDMEKYPSTADDSGTLERQATYLATRTVNALTGATEWPHQLMAYALAGYRSYLSSDTFWYLFPRELASYIEDDRCAVVSGVGLEEEKEVKDSSGDDEELQEGHDVSSIQRRLEKLVGTSADECRVEAAPGGPLRKTGAKMYTVNKEVFFVTQAESYRHQGKHFAEYSPLEFEMIVDVLPRQEAGTELPGTRRGRPKKRGFDLSPSLLLSPRFQGFVRAKFRTPMLGGAPLPSLRKDGDPLDVLGKYLVCLMSEWALDNGRPSYALNGDGLLNLCANWNRSGASFVDRGRYRVLENILQKGYRSSRNEKACSEWRSRNADFWADVAVDSSRSSRPTEHAPSDYGSDTEASGSLAPEELLELTVAAAAKDLKAVKTARAMRSTFWSLIPNGGACSRAIQTGDEDPVFSQAGDFPSLAHIAKNVHAMLSPEHIDPDPSCPVGADTQGDSRPGRLSAGFADCAERMAYSTDQRELFDRIIGSVERNGKLRQTLTLLDGGGGTRKSRLMRMITLFLRRHGIDTVNTCPTGVGACHLVNGKTFHSAFKTFRKGSLSPNDLELLRLMFSEKVALIVIDEASMFCAEFLVLLDQRLRAIYNSDQVFGGRSVLLVGDFLQLEVTAGTPLCKVLYMTTASDVLLSARVLFRLFSVYFLETQHRAAACTAQQSNLSTCRALPSFYPSGQRWADENAASFCPMTDAVVSALTNALTVQDVANDQAWMDDLTILVTSNVDTAILTSCTARLFATRQKKTLFLWRRQLRKDLPTALENVVYDEDANPELFAYFVVGAPANVLDNNSGNVGWGSQMERRIGFILWLGTTKRNATLYLRSLKMCIDAGGVVDLPFPPDFINVRLVDNNENGVLAEQWPPENNLETLWLYQKQDASNG